MIQLLFTDQAGKQLAKLDKSARGRIIASLDRLREAYPVGDLRKMQGYDDLWRLRVGDYRVVMHIDLVTAIITITVIRVGHRREVYR
ncbi:MAG: type II toxin-antitoxin system RelE/ParE family toxin [Desulfuromonadaceae bacterium]|nr:type II toxin-antitoxin system RelE/ParE family toxin [Desulfuromonadaceae bacterium]